MTLLRSMANTMWGVAGAGPRGGGSARSPEKIGNERILCDGLAISQNIA